MATGHLWKNGLHHGINTYVETNLRPQWHRIIHRLTKDGKGMKVRGSESFITANRSHLSSSFVLINGNQAMTAKAGGQFMSQLLRAHFVASNNGSGHKHTKNLTIMWRSRVHVNTKLKISMCYWCVVQIHMVSTSVCVLRLDLHLKSVAKSCISPSNPVSLAATANMFGRT